jgi:hypothetical protein
MKVTENAGMSARRSTPVLLFAAAVAGLALAGGCSSGAHSGSAIPSAIPGTIPGAIPGPLAAVTAQGDAVSRPHAATDTIGVAINVPPAPSHLPNVLAIGLDLDGKAKAFTAFDLEAGGPCSALKAGGFHCLVDLQAPPGNHSIVVTGYNAVLNGHKPKAGSLVSTNAVPIKVADAHNPLSLAFYSVTSSIAVLGQDPAITGSARAGFTVDRHALPGPAPFALITRDASGKYVVGPASPSFDVTASNARFEIAQPSRNALTIADSGLSAASAKLHVSLKGKSSPSCPNDCRLVFDVSLGDDSTTPTPPPPTATPSPTPTPVPTATPVPTPPPTPGPTATPTPTALVFVSYATAGGGAIRAFNLHGTLQTSWTLSNSPSALAFDSSNGFLYAVTNGAASPITAFDHNGNPQTLSPDFGSLGTVTSITYDSHDNELYVAAGGTVKAYDGNGSLILGSAFSGFTSTTPGGMTFDATNRNLYLIDGTGIEEWTEAGVKASASGFAAPSGCNTAGCVPTALVFNPPGLNWLYAVWSDGSSKTAMACYLQSGGNCSFGAGSSAFNTIDQPAQIAYDPSTANVYVANQNGISVWSLEGSKVTTSGTFPGGTFTSIDGIAIGY